MSTNIYYTFVYPKKNNSNNNHIMLKISKYATNPISIYMNRRLSSSIAMQCIAVHLLHLHCNRF